MPPHRSSTIAQRVFLVGCPRSGTTLVQSVLGSHPEIATFPESHVFRRVFGLRRRRRAVTGLASRVAEKTFNEFVEAAGLQEIGVGPPRLPFASLYARNFVRLLDEATQRRGKSIWLEKTPDHWRHVDVIRRSVPGAKFIQVVREGAATIASLYEVSRRADSGWGGAPWSIDKCFEAWRDAALNAIARSRDADYLVARYEDFVDQPESHARQIASFVGVGYDAAMLDKRQETALATTTQDESWKQGASQKIERSNSKLDKLFTPEEQAGIRERVRAVDLGALPPVADPGSI